MTISAAILNPTPGADGIRESRRAEVVAAALGHDLSTIYKLLKSGDLQGYHGGPKRRQVLIYIDSIASYQAAEPIGPAAKAARRQRQATRRAAAEDAREFLRENGCL